MYSNLTHLRIDNLKVGVMNFFLFYYYPIL